MATPPSAAQSFSPSPETVPRLAKADDHEPVETGTGRCQQVKHGLRLAGKTGRVRRALDEGLDAVADRAGGPAERQGIVDEDNGHALFRGGQLCEGDLGEQG